MMTSEELEEVAISEAEAMLAVHQALYWKHYQPSEQELLAERKLITWMNLGTPISRAAWICSDTESE